MIPIELQVDGEPFVAHVAASATLLEVLRDQLDVTGPKRGCELGECGACMVHVDGTLRHACLAPAALLDGAAVRTVRSLGAPGRLGPLQEAFIEHLGFQCGYCTSGQLMAADALLQERPDPTREEIERHMAGNLCRCTGYYKIVDAIAAASAEEGARDGR